LAGVRNDDLASIAELEAIFGGEISVDEGWRTQSFGDDWRVAWIVRHPPKDCEHGLVLATGGSLESFAEPPARVDVGDWAIAGRNVINYQFVRFGVGEGTYSLHVESMRDSTRPRLIDVARLLAARVPRAEPPGGLTRFCTQADAAAIFGAPAGFPSVWEESSATWKHLATVLPVHSESLLFQRPANSPFEDPPTLERPALFTRLHRTHDPDGAPGTVDASGEVWWTQGDTLYRLAHFRNTYKPDGGTIEYVGIEALIALARTIASRLEDADR
jgi:hypothetical protein